ncbi:metal ABC transporter permease [Facklamia miroungae]|uniref:Manganese/zinc/iron transport system permease protein n=1 Tax=Facklamia miroungae TaxID=120956 RepID=A0A1G7PEZ6_9LACT|nr:metal ABC transporter permease [Facklamia miroungae]NKZ28669.1 metal ABC transporter permease [Facklamia miroungae]SDF84219.1 manganese/zinc/iron transport system permease protein [Facklamia miroungae]
MIDNILLLFDITYESLIILVLTAIACAIIGCFLLLRNLSMLGDAISHTVLLGIVLAYFIAHDLTSPLLIIGAALIGVFTVWGVESLSNTGLIKNDDAVGVVYPLFFALSVILITKYGGNVHLDTDAVLMGDVGMASLTRLEVFGISIAKSAVQMSVMLLINALFIIIFYKELKITTFDAQFAQVAGFTQIMLFYGLMLLTSITTVVAFDAVGAILVISFLIAPAASAYLIVKKLNHMLFVACLYATFNSVLGYFIGLGLNVSLSGMTATIAGITFGLTFLFNKNGFITQMIRKGQQKQALKEELFIMHLANHRNTANEMSEAGFQSMKEHLQWTQEQIEKIGSRLIKNDEVYHDIPKDTYQLTSKGQVRLESLKERYKL